MKSLFEEMGGTYRQVGDYLIPNLVLPDDGDYQIGKYGRMRRSYLKEQRKILYTNYVMEGTLFKHLSEIIQCVADMRTQDVKAIREFGKFIPAFAAFEKNRLSLYREAAKEAEEIFDRWADEIDDLDENYEPDEYYSD